MKNPWETGAVETVGGRRIRPAYCDARSRMDRVKKAGVETLRAMIAWPNTQKAVRLAAERRLWKLSNDTAHPQAGQLDGSTPAFTRRWPDGTPRFDRRGEPFRRKHDNVDLLVVHLVLTYHWFDEMTAGRKHMEYRAMTPHWRRLLWDRRDQIDVARFSRGYTATTITRPVYTVDVGPCPYDGWDGDYYRLHLGPIMHNVKDEARL